MKSRGNYLFFLGKAVYFIGVLLVLNFFFGLLFFRFFFWLIFGAVMLGLFLGALTLGKKALFREFRMDGNGSRREKNSRRDDVIDVEAKVYDDDEPAHRKT